MTARADNHMVQVHTFTKDEPYSRKDLYCYVPKCIEREKLQGMIELLIYIGRGKPIQCIKIMRGCSGLGLKDSKEYCDIARDLLDVVYGKEE